MVIFPQMPPLAPGPIVHGTRTYDLLEPMLHDRGIVPSGFRTDGASVPRPLWPFFPHDGKSFASAIIHDFDYRYSEGTRKAVDICFLDNMTMCGLAWLHRHLIYRGVRIGGWNTWNKYRRAKT